MLKELAEQIPTDVRNAKKYIGTLSDTFHKYAACPKCHSVYVLDTCKVNSSNNTIVSRKCNYIQFPNHPHSLQRSRCDTLLMKIVRSSHGTNVLYPRQLYCYNSLINSFKDFVRRPGFITKCELWRNRETKPNVMSDIYDGRVWQTFMSLSGEPFLSLPYNFALSLNVDRFQPFKFSNYSSGVIYVAIQNLPRRERYLTNNIILLGIIPGPHEPKRSINSFLLPLIKELKELWQGVTMESPQYISVIVRCALICTSCDIPASRKVSGFVGHSAYHGCSRCLKSFPTEAFGQKPDYTGTNRSSWVPRDMTSHRKQAENYKYCSTRARQKEIERTHGCRYSVLLELPYYDVIRFSVIDPMHNLLLGTAKHMLSVWSSTGILNKSHFSIIQEKVDAFITPSHVGRIPSKISSGFSSFTAEQWKNWILIYSLYALKDILPNDHYECWLKFVKATSLLCCRQIALTQLEEGDLMIMNFCDSFHNLYGKELYNINLHLHGHLKECIIDYGPVYSFWLFSFERLNGVLGNYSSNCKDISLQLMRKFLSSNKHCVENWPKEYRDNFSSLLSHVEYQQGSLKPGSLDQALQSSNNQDVSPLPPIFETAWKLHEKSKIHELLFAFLSHNDYTVLSLYNKTTALSVGGFLIGSCKSNYITKSHVMVIHPTFKKPYLAKIEHFAKLMYMYNNNKSNVMYMWTACISIFQEHNCKEWFGGPTQVWTKPVVDMHYIRLPSILCHVAICDAEIDFEQFGKETVNVISPLSHISEPAPAE